MFASELPYLDYLRPLPKQISTIMLIRCQVNNQERSTVAEITSGNFQRDIPLGRMDAVCNFCQAHMWLKERMSGSIANPQFQVCCVQGSIVLPPLEPTPPTIARLLRSNTDNGGDFREQIRGYNTNLSFTSLGAQIDESVANNRSGAYCYRIQGGIYHRIGGLLPPTDNQTPAFAQLCIYDSDTQLAHRNAVVPYLRNATLLILQDLLMEINPFVPLLLSMAHVLRESDGAVDVRLLISAENTPDARRYNAPTASEVGVILVDSTITPNSSRDIVLQSRSHGLQRISEMNQHYDALQYVLMFPHGDLGWNIHARSPGGRSIMVMQWYSYRLMVRSNGHNMHLFGRLFQQYIVDMYAKMEQNQLTYLRLNQTNLRTDLYRGVVDAVELGDNDLQSVGQRVILPSTFIGSPRHMRQLYHDSMNIVRRCGQPDLFITLTCNPQWKKIQDELVPLQAAVDRPDLCARVFNMKRKKKL